MTARTRLNTDDEPAQEAAAPKDDALANKYRPLELRDVLGQDAVIKSLGKVLESRTSPHAYLFTGPAGVGKTTLARIIAKHVGCLPHNILEVNAAVTTGIDAMRAITETLKYQGFGANPNRMIIVDECHALSKAAWQSLLKDTEEPPAHVFWVFCTTDSGKVPPTIVTRCTSYDLRPLKHSDLMDLLEDVCKAEGFDTPEWVLGKVARASEGSARHALSMLLKVHQLSNEDDVDDVLSQPLERPEIVDLCRLLVKGDLTWPKLTQVLKDLGEPAESVRVVVVNYLASCAMGARTEKEAARLLDMMAPFSKPFATSDKNAPLLLAFGDIIL